MALSNKIPLEKWLTPIVKVGLKYILLHPVHYTHIFIQDGYKKTFDQNKKKYKDAEPDEYDEEEEENEEENSENSNDKEESVHSDNSYLPNLGSYYHRKRQKEAARNILNHLTWDSIVSPHKHLLLTVPNGQYGNDDRGNGPGKLGFKAEDFTWEIKKDDGITVKDLVEGVYRLKGSKYTLFYELLTQIKILENSPEKLHLEVHFDYGS